MNLFIIKRNSETNAWLTVVASTRRQQDAQAEQTV